jgi:hypothetical protein
MRSTEILRAVNEKRTDEHRFVRWWRKEEDFLDYDLVDRFIDNTSASDEIGGIDLLTMDDMWNEVKRIGGTRVTLVHEPNGDRVEWSHKGRKDVCMFTPETLMRIFDSETRGNPVDS